MDLQQTNALSSLRQWRKRISTGMDQILPGLYVGGLRDAIDSKQLEENQIRAVVSVHGFTKNCEFGPHIEALRVILSDSPGENVLKHFSDTNSFIHRHRLGEENVLIHCLAGASRSVCIAIAYLMTVTNLNYPNALDYMSSKRYCSQPNFGFKMQLMRFGEKCLYAERKRLFSESCPDREQQEIFLRLYHKDCICTNSTFIKGAREAESQFSSNLECP